MISKKLICKQFLPKVFVAFLFFCPLFASSQTRLVLNNDAYIIINNGAKVVLEDASTNALATLGSGGNIVSEGEDNQLIWDIGTATGAYTVPFTTTPAAQGGNGTKIPFTIDISASGIGTGDIKFSTYETNTDTNTPFPSMVTSLDNTSGVDGSLRVVDRFWLIKAEGYTSKPSSTMTFGYDDAANEIGGTNTINEASLRAQRFNVSADSWETLLFGTANTAANTVSSVNVVPNDFHDAWILVDEIQPLPVVWQGFDVYHAGEGMGRLEWVTLSENNTSHYEIEHSMNLVNWNTLGYVDAAGNTQNISEYEYYHALERGVNYYRVKQVDLDGAYDYTDIKHLNYDQTSGSSVIFGNPFDDHLTISIPYPGETVLSIYALDGRLVKSEIRISKGLFTIKTDDLAPGNYALRVSSLTKEEVHTIIKLD